MKTVAIITLNGEFNFGNRLQNYAIQYYLQKNNVNCQTIRKKNSINLKHCIKTLINYKGQRYYNKREKLFKNFTKQYINNYFIKSNLKEVENKFDFFSTGSDQVWNPLYGALTKFELLSDIAPQKRISFSASFGISELPLECRQETAEQLKEFKAISVREESAKKIILDLTGRDDVDVLVDPTMLLLTEEWSKIARKPSGLKGEKYILNYFLGNVSDTRKIEIERIAKENNCKIINILDQNDPCYLSGPSEFLYLEKNAFLICTDSFHSSVFAILFDRPFVIFEREDSCESMNSRIDTLLSKFNLKNRKYNNKYISNDNINHDYTEAYKILEEERKKSQVFLKKALDLND